MELSFQELQKKDVINIVDGKSLGRIKDLKLSFPRGLLTGIIVPGNRGGFLSKLFDRNKIFIPVKNITKIGGDVILVRLSCGDSCEPSINTGEKNKPCPPPNCNNNCNPLPNPNQFFNDRIDDGDY